MWPSFRLLILLPIHLSPGITECCCDCWGSSSSSQVFKCCISIWSQRTTFESWFSSFTMNSGYQNSGSQLLLPPEPLTTHTDFKTKSKPSSHFCWNSLVWVWVLVQIPVPVEARGVRSPGAGRTGGCELAAWDGFWDPGLVLCKSSTCSPATT